MGSDSGRRSAIVIPVIARRFLTRLADFVFADLEFDFESQLLDSLKLEGFPRRPEDY